MESQDLLHAMMRQEERGYISSDYLNAHEDVMLGADVECRSKMVQWCYQITDFCSFNRETAAIAVSFLDRYLGTDKGLEALVDTNLFQLSAMTALYTAVKIHEPQVMGVDLLVKLSRGAYSAEELETMELTMLQAVGWLVNTPTALSFVRQFLELLPPMVDKAVLDAAYDLSKFQAELAVADYSFVQVKASSVAYSSLINSFECLAVDPRIQETFSSTLAGIANIDRNGWEIQEIQSYLYQAVTKQTEGDRTSSRTSDSNRIAQQQPNCESTRVQTSPCTVTA